MNANTVLNNVLRMGILWALAFASYSCSGNDDNDNTSIDNGKDNRRHEGFTIHFNGPTYADNYTPLSSWASRGQWNLANVHDPSVVKDGAYYYMYQTDASYGNVHEGHGHFPYRRSTDLVNWQYQGAAFAQTPSWIKDSLNNKRARMNLEAIENPIYGHWAPYIHTYNGKYRLYYSVVVENPIVGDDRNTSWTERAFIGLAESTDLAGNIWEDKGMVICSEPDGIETYTRTGNNDWSGYYKFNAIDPTVISAEGKEWLIYGSWHTGIAIVALDPSTGKPYQLTSVDDYGVRIAGRGNVNSNRWQALEAPEIIYNPDTGYYYLFLAYDELSVAYNTRVARAKNIQGPYLGINGANVTNGAECWPMVTHPYRFNGHTGWVGFSHGSVFKNNENNKWYYTSQARLPENVSGIHASNAVMMGHIREILWTEGGWPVVAPERYAAVPEFDFGQDDLVGRWEQITMNYQYRTVQTSKTIIFNTNGTYSGELTGSWLYDNTKNSLYIDGNECKLFRAWDWESTPRKVTLTYSGYTADGKPIWGKLIL